MHFFKSAVIAVLAFVVAAAAIPTPESEGWAPPPPECKPLLESCSKDSDCCSDGCLLGVSQFKDDLHARRTYFGLPSFASWLKLLLNVVGFDRSMWVYLFGRLECDMVTEHDDSPFSA